MKMDKEKVTIPKRVQDVLPIRVLWPDGIFQVGGVRKSGFHQYKRRKEDFILKQYPTLWN